MTKNCEQYFEDPEAHEAHLESCAECREMFETLDAEIESAPRPVAVEALPLAPWEGAAHKTWPLVLAGGIALLILAIGLFVAAGMSPLQGIVRALVSAVPSLRFLMKFSELAGGALHNAPAGFHIIVAVSFVVINTILFLLLRRAPRGVDV